MFTRLPIRIKIAGACSTMTALAVVVFAAGTLVNVYHEGVEVADMELDAEAQHVAQLIATGGFSHERIQAVQVETPEPWAAFALFSSDGRLWRSSHGVPEEVVRAALPVHQPTTVHHRDGSWRTKSFVVGVETVVVTFDMEEIHGTMCELLYAYLLALPFAGVVAGLGGWWVAGRTMTPVKVMTRAAQEISAENLVNRVPTPPANDELAELARVFNAMLERLEQGFLQARCFAADASHELRTPLTIIRGSVDALLRRGEFTAEVETSLLSVLEETSRLERITGNLLVLARLDAGSEREQWTEVDLSSLVLEACEDVEHYALSRNVVLETSIEPEVGVRGDSDLLRRLALNLLDNAIKFNNQGGRVRCELNVHGCEARFAVGNTGPGIPADLQPRIFERFFRADPARTAKGYGLGLALSREIARAHDGALQLSEDSSPGWTQFEAVFPARIPGRTK